MTPKKERALLALLSCPTAREAARVAGIHESTLRTYWKDPAFVQAYNDCKDGNNTAMRAFDELSQVANRCSGQRYDGCKDSNAVIVEMGARWEELTANAIEEF